jgi:hypothetical protein
MTETLCRPPKTVNRDLSTDSVQVQKGRNDWAKDRTTENKEKGRPEIGRPFVGLSFLG